MRTVICAPRDRAGVMEARSRGIPRGDIVLAGSVHRLRGLLGFSVLVVEGFSGRGDATEIWETLRQRAHRSRAYSAGGPVLPFRPPHDTVLYRADVEPGAVAAATSLLEPFATGSPPMVPLDAAAILVADLLERHILRNTAGAGDGDGERGTGTRPP